MTWGRQGFTLGLGLSLLTGCFQDAGEVGGSANASGTTSAETGGDECPAGTPGCACYGNATCNANLQCLPDLLLCIPENCATGDLGCPCDAGVCSGELTCVGGLCMEPAPPGTGDSGPVTGTAGTSAGMTDEGAVDDSTGDTSEVTRVVVHAGPEFDPALRRWGSELRDHLDALCVATRPGSCSAGHALFSTSPADSIAELALNSVPAGVGVEGPTGIEVAADFGAMLGGELVMPLDAVELNGTAEGNPSTYWTSSVGSGQYNDMDNCGNWMAPIGTGANGAIGSTDMADASWIVSGVVPCNTALPILCACW